MALAPRAKQKKRKAAVDDGTANGSVSGGPGPKRRKPLTWDGLHEQLKVFKEKYGHTQVPNYGEWQFLCSWLHRSKKRKTGPHSSLPQLAAAQIEKLDKVGIDWTFRFNALHRSWDASFAELQTFYKKNGHCNVRKQTEPRLYAWLGNQKRRHSGESRLSAMNEGQIENLKSVGVSWA